MEAKKNLAEKDSQLAEQESQLEKQNNQLLSMAKAMQQSGMDLQTIATAMQLPMEKVAQMLRG